MAKGKLILICQSGGEFVTNDDGTMSYNGGEANAANVTSETPFNDLKLQLAEVCNLDQKTVTLKYFLPGNKKNLIVVKNDKDVKRMIDFHGDAITAEVFVMGTAGFDRSTLEMQSNRESAIQKDEMNHDNLHNKKDASAKRGKVRTKKDEKVPISPPGKRTRRATAAETEMQSDEDQEGGNGKSDDAMSEGTTDGTSSSAASDHGNEKADSDSGSDYAPRTRSSAHSSKRNSQSEIDVDASPADTVKKRRRTPSWRFGANGRPTIVSFPDNNYARSKSRGKSGKAIAETSGDRRSQRKSSRETSSGRKRARRSIVPEAGDSDQELDNLPGKESDSEENLPLTVCDDYALPETMVDAWKSAITGAGQEFDSVNQFRAALKKYAIANRFGYRFKKNDTSRAIGGCAAEGCTWRFYAVWVPTTQSFMIKTLNNVHTCDKESRKSAHPAKNWLDFGVALNYTQVWRGIGDAREQLHGSPKESYNKLPWFCEKLVETNPGSICKLVIGDKKRFKSLFVSFYAAISGFQNGCRPLIFLEATSMKSRYGEVLLIAIAIDGNEGFIPVAFAIVDVEDDNSWCWFLELLKTSILKSQPITFVVDRDTNLKNYVLAVFEDAYIGYSIYHLLASFKRNMKGPFHGDGKAFLTVHFLAAAHAVRLVGFKKSTEQIKVISSQAYDWIMQIEPEHWASSSFKGERYNYITEDVFESYSKLMEDYRHLPILQKVDALIRTMIDDMEDAKLDSTMWCTQLTALKEKELEDEKLKSRGLKVLISSDTLFEVREDSTHVVNLSIWSCTCMGWKETGLPCRHALAVFSLTGKNPYDFCSSYFTADAYRLTYAESIRPTPIDGPPLQQNTIHLEKEEAEALYVENAEGEKEGGGKGDYELEDAIKETEGKIEKGHGSIEDSEMEETNKEEGEKMEVQMYEGFKEGNEEGEGSNVDAENEEGSKVNSEKDEGSNVEAQKEEGGKLNAEKDEGSDVDAQKEEGGKLDAEKDEGSNVDAQKEEGGKLDTEKDEGSNVDAQIEEGGKLNAEKDEVSNVDVQKDEGSKLNAEKDEGSNLDAEKEADSKIDEEKEEDSKLDEQEEEGRKLDVEKDEGSKLDVEKEEGKKVNAGKDEGKMVKIREEHEDPNVFVLPPLVARPSSSIVKKEMDIGVETEGDMKRKVTCSKCKKVGHYKKSCRTKF
ncbi:uncharacterized protein LOC112508172 isoform X2 [Cynara cardunculus var. scolymus]|uniref:uncharacterized protein LOC112508172 isoform X2 n=1 Tax=Cynara cardunculus var. scolymus TaxID=59895 RepID=UPI000D623549|nr:uncharacterized protein LOC112508172 isoform X2 [Cynara cardunculus var. scolymus]